MQNLMDDSYELWSTGIRYPKFLLRLDYLQRCAVVAGNFNYQVENGGLFQWLDNSYHVGSEYLLDLIEVLQGKEDAPTESLNFVRQMVETVITELDGRENLNGVYNCEYEMIYEELEEFNDPYFDEHGEKFLHAVADFLSEEISKKES